MKFLAIFIFIIFCQNYAYSESKDVLRIGTSAEFDTTNPLLSTSAVTGYMIYTAWRPLVIFETGRGWRPMLITAVPTLENKMVKRLGAGLEVSIELIPSAQWGDGVPVTCKDIELAWKIGRDPNVSIGSREMYDNIQSVSWDEKSPKKCKFEFKTAKFDYFINLVNPMPSHLEGPVYEKFKNVKEGYERNSLYVKEPATAGLYNGPYKIKELKLGSHVIFDKNPLYKGKQGYFKQLVFKLIPKTSALTAHLMTKEIDIISSAGGLSLDLAIAFDKKIKQENLPYKIQYADGTVYTHIDLNLGNKALAELPVRQALLLMTDQKEIVDAFFDGKAKPAYQFVPENNLWNVNRITQKKTNQREAIRLLEGAGWKLGADGIRVKDGQKLSFVFYGFSDNSIYQSIQVLLQNKWKNIGVEIRIKNEPARVLGDTLKNRKFDMLMYSWVPSPESSPRGQLHSSQIPSESNNWSGQNFPGWKNKEVDKLTDQLELEFNSKKRARLAGKIIELYRKEIPVIPMYYPPDQAVLPKNLTGYEVTGHSYVETLFVENWKM